MTRAKLDLANAPRFSPEDRAHIEALSEAEIDRIAASDPDAAPPTDEMLDAAVIARRVRLIREQLGLGQAAFAEMFHIPIGTLRDWEQGRRKLDAPARAYLTVIERDPEAVRRALQPV